MRRAWQQEIDGIRERVERPRGNPAERLVRLEVCVLMLLDHVENLSKLVDKHDEYVSQKW